jgi:peptidoglycan/xylan/chitin deacetylase (PgdA/CDA1 family)
VIATYHAVLPEGAAPWRSCIGQALPVESVRRQILWLAARFEIVPASEFVRAPKSKRGAQRAAITFDDGSEETFECVAPFLRREGLPATLFLSTGHLCGGLLLWFSYLNALCFEGVYDEVVVGDRLFRLLTLEERKRARSELGSMARKSRRPSEFVGRIATAYPLPQDVRRRYGGMTAEQLALAGRDDLLEIGSHTVTHPFLTDISPDERSREMLESRERLNLLTGRPIRLFAYPGGDYDQAVVSEVRGSGYQAAFATRPRKLGFEGFEIGRVGIYSPSLLKFSLKARGLVEVAEAVGMRVG